MKFRQVIRFPRRLLWAMFLESVETKNMVRTFVKHGQGRLLLRTAQKPTEEEMQQAINQLKDIPKFLPFFIVIVVPLPGVTEGYMLLAVTLEKWLGSKVSLLPSQFRELFKKPEEIIEVEEIHVSVVVEPDGDLAPAIDPIADRDLAPQKEKPSVDDPV